MSSKGGVAAPFRLRPSESMGLMKNGGTAWSPPSWDVPITYAVRPVGVVGSDREQSALSPGVVGVEGGDLLRSSILEEFISSTGGWKTSIEYLEINNVKFQCT